MDFTVIVDVFTNYKDDLINADLSPRLFLSFSIVILLVSIIRFIIILKIEESKSKIKHLYKSYKIYIAGHILLEALIALIVCYFIVKTTHANPNNYILNLIFAPGVGEIIGIWIDDFIILKMEKSGNSLLRTDNSDKHKKSENDSDNNININTGDVVEKQPRKHHSRVSEIKHLDPDKIPDDEFDITIINAINQMRDNQLVHTEQIKSNNDTLSSIATTIDIIRESQMNDKKIELKRMIYECLDKGFATPEQNDKITTYYKSYCRLNGNGEIRELYEVHYLKLNIHRDRRRSTNNEYYGPEKRRRSSNGNCEYGQFDTDNYSES